MAGTFKSDSKAHSIAKAISVNHPTQIADYNDDGSALLHIKDSYSIPSGTTATLSKKQLAGTGSTSTKDYEGYSISGDGSVKFKQETSPAGHTVIHVKENTPDTTDGFRETSKAHVTAKKMSKGTKRTAEYHCDGTSSLHCKKEADANKAIESMRKVGNVSNTKDYNDYEESADGAVKFKHSKSADGSSVIHMKSSPVSANSWYNSLSEEARTALSQRSAIDE